MNSNLEDGCVPFYDLFTAEFTKKISFFTISVDEVVELATHEYRILLYNSDSTPNHGLKVMNKGQLIDAVQGQLGDSRANAEAAVNAVLDSVTAGVVSAGSVQIIGFGTFKKANRAARMGVNPRTGARIQIAASTTVTFKAGAKLKAAV